MNFTHENYLSPFTWRYGSDEMRGIWSEHERRRLMRRVWVALATAQAEVGLVRAEQVADLVAHQNQIDIERALEFEAELRHDVMAEIRTYAEQCTIGGGIIHLGMTSQDVLDNADALRLKAGLALIEKRLADLLKTLAEMIEQWADVPTMAFTHIQPAEPTTIGYRLAIYAQDLLMDYLDLERVQRHLRGKGLKGAVGTSASYTALLSDTDTSPQQLEARFMAILGLEAFRVTHQTYPRKQDWQIGNVIAGVAGSLYKFAFDLRLLQSPPIGEWSEPFGAGQVGSSAMPFKRNPIKAENLDSLGRWIAAQVSVLWDNAAHSLLERTLDDSANRRLVLPGLFLALDEMLSSAQKIVAGLTLHEAAIARNLATYGPFAAVESVLMAAAKAGGNRQVLHEHLREHSLAAWAAIQAGEANPLTARLLADETLLAYLSLDELRAALDYASYVGDAPERARDMADTIQKYLKGD